MRKCNKLLRFANIAANVVIAVSLVVILCSDALKVSDTIIVATIGATGTFVTIAASIYIATKNANKNSELQRAAEMRKIKRDYYHKFLETLHRRISDGNSEKVDDFFMESNRLPLYASEEVIKLVEEIKKNNDSINFDILYKLIRKDVLTDEILELKDVKMTMIFSGNTQNAPENQTTPSGNNGHRNV